MRRQDYITRAGMYQGLWKKAGKIGKPLAPFCFLAPHRSTDSFPKVLQSAYIGMWQTGYLIPNQIFSWRNLIVLLGLSIHSQSHQPLCVVEIELSGFRDHFQRRCPLYCKIFCLGVSILFTTSWCGQTIRFSNGSYIAEPLDNSFRGWKNNEDLSWWPMIWSEFLFGAVEISSIERMFAHTLITAALGGNATLLSVTLFFPIFQSSVGFHLCYQINFY